VPHVIPPVKKVRWVNAVFFVVTTLIGVLGTPFYIARFGLSTAEILIFIFFMLATGLSITMGYHRLYAHASYRANPIIQFLYLFFGAAAFEQSALKWAAQHRIHHQYVDTDEDPYSIKKGFWYAHIGWLIFWKHHVDYSIVKDLQASRMASHQHKHYGLWSVTAGIGLPVLLGALTGHALGAFIICVCLRITLVYHTTFFINSVCHMFGKATYDIYASARDHWFVAFLTYGEGYHNFHHRFPSDYRNGVRWYQWDPSKWFIALLSHLGLVRDLKRVSQFQVLHARVAAENKRISDRLTRQLANQLRCQKTLEAFHLQYEQLRKSLVGWELAVKEYSQLLQDRVARQSQEVRAAAYARKEQARLHFKEIHSRWTSLIKLSPLALEQLFAY